MYPQFASILPPNVKPILKRPPSPSFRENTRHGRHIRWDESMADITASGHRVHRTDGRRDTKPMDVFHRDQHDQRPQRQRDVKVTDVSHKGQHIEWLQRQRGEKASHGGPHVQWAQTQRDFKTTDISHRGQHAQWPRTQQEMTKISYNQGKGHPFQRDARMPSHNQGRGQHVQHDARMAFHSQDRSQHTQRDALLTSHSQSRNQHARRDTRIAFQNQGSAHYALPDDRTIDAANSNAIHCKDPPGPVGKLHCKPLLTQIYADIHAASLPGAIHATADLAQLTLLECRQFSTQNWFRCNAALQTRAMFKVIGK